MNAATLPHNRKSQTMLLRLGFSEEGFAKKYIQIDGRRQDHILYGLDAADFSGATGKAG
jgi:ribosomal-protein-alanine N-acetyltransferase